MAADDPALRSVNYYRTLITVAGDCPVETATRPPARATPTVAEIQFQLLADAPHVLTQDEVLFESHLRHKGIDCETPEDRARLWAEFFGKSQACMRASPLPRRYGWGLLCDEAGRVALLPMESAEYRRLVAGPGEVTLLPAMRTKRAAR